MTPKKDQVGDTFYLCNSSFEYFPGLPIHKSTDLVNWSWAGHGLHRQEQVGNAVGFDRSRGEITWEMGWVLLKAVLFLEENHGKSWGVHIFCGKSPAADTIVGALHR